MDVSFPRSRLVVLMIERLCVYACVYVYANLFILFICVLCVYFVSIVKFWSFCNNVAKVVYSEQFVVYLFTGASIPPRQYKSEDLYCLFILPILVKCINFSYFRSIEFFLLNLRFFYPL